MSRDIVGDLCKRAAASYEDSPTADLLHAAANRILWLEGKLIGAPGAIAAQIEAEYERTVEVIDSLIEDDQDKNDWLLIRRKGIEWGVKLAVGVANRWKGEPSP